MYGVCFGFHITKYQANLLKIMNEESLFYKMSLKILNYLDIQDFNLDSTEMYKISFELSEEILALLEKEKWLKE